MAHMARTISRCPLPRRSGRGGGGRTQVDRFIVVSPLCHFNEFSQPRPLDLSAPPPWLAPATPHCRRAWAVFWALTDFYDDMCLFSSPPPLPSPPPSPPPLPLPCLSFSAFPLLAPLLSLPGNWVSAQLLPSRVAAARLPDCPSARPPAPSATLATLVAVVVVRAAAER